MVTGSDIGVTSGRGRNPDLSGLMGEDSSSVGDGTQSIAEDDVFEVLCNRRRRQVIEYLQEHGETTAVGDLAEVIAAEEEGTTIQKLSSSERKRVYVSLYQNHLPVMDDAGIVDYDGDRKMVHLREVQTDIEPYLTGAVNQIDRRVTTSFALVAAMLVLVGGFQIGAFGLLSTAVWSILGGVGLVSVVALELALSQ